MVSPAQRGREREREGEEEGGSTYMYACYYKMKYCTVNAGVASTASASASTSNARRSCAWSSHNRRSRRHDHDRSSIWKQQQQRQQQQQQQQQRRIRVDAMSHTRTTKAHFKHSSASAAISQYTEHRLSFTKSIIILSSRPQRQQRQRRQQSQCKRLQCRNAQGGGGGSRANSQAQLREEATAPFRAFRLFIFAALGASAGIGSAITLIRTLASALGAPNAAPLLENVENLGIDVVALIVCGFLWKRDNDARLKAIERIEREETLSDLLIQIQAKNVKKTVKLSKLRGFVRPVLLAGSSKEVDESVNAAIQIKEDLEEKGVVVIPYVLDCSPDEFNELVSQWRSQLDGDEKLLCIPQKLFMWKEWFGKQMSIAGLKDVGVYLSLRLDGRVRASGKGMPPLTLIAASLPSMTTWSGMMDGFDGSVNPLK